MLDLLLGFQSVFGGWLKPVSADCVELPQVCVSQPSFLVFESLLAEDWHELIKSLFKACSKLVQGLFFSHFQVYLRSSNIIPESRKPRFA